MRVVGSSILVMVFVVGCGRVHTQSSAAVAACSTADKTTLDELNRVMREPTTLERLERARADTATTAALTRMLADTASLADLRRLATDSTLLQSHQAQFDELLGELARYRSCSR